MKARLSNLALVTAAVLAVVAVVRPFEPEAAADAIDVHPTLWAVLAAPDVGTEPANPPRRAPLERPRDAVIPLSPEMIAACLAVAEDLDEGLARQLRELRDRDRAAFERRLRTSRRLISMAELRERDSVLYDLKLLEMKTDATVSRLAAEARAARRSGSAQAPVLESQLRGQVIVQLAFRHRAREGYLRQLCELVERMERELEHDREHFDEVLANRMKELLEPTE